MGGARFGSCFPCPTFIFQVVSLDGQTVLAWFLAFVCAVGQRWDWVD